MSERDRDREFVSEWLRCFGRIGITVTCRAGFSRSHLYSFYVMGVEQKQTGAFSAIFCRISAESARKHSCVVVFESVFP